MKRTVNISVVGRFHAFDLARQMEKHGRLGQLRTTYPASIPTKWGIPRKKIRSELDLELLNRYGAKIPLIDQRTISLFLLKEHGRRSLQQVRRGEIFIGWSGSSLEALRRAKALGVTTILERGSSHCDFWRQIMVEESAFFGKSFNQRPETLARELEEYELADYISIPSRFVQRTFLDRGFPQQRLLLNPYGVDLEAFRPTEKKDRVFRVLSVGGFSIRKGSRYILQAFSELNLPNSEYWHVGTVTDDLKPFIKKYESERIRFFGHQPQNQLFRFYSQASVFVIASVEEGLAMVQCQAMACGLPIICTPHSGGEDLIAGEHPCGFSTPIRDVEALKERILQLYEDTDLCQSMGRLARERAESNSTWDHYGVRYEQNLQKLEI